MTSHGRTLCGAGLLIILSLWGGVASAQQTVAASGVVDSAAITGPRWAYTTFSTGNTGDISVSVDWDNPAANLDVFLKRQNADSTWTTIAQATSAIAKPEKLVYSAAPFARYRVGVRATSGAAVYTLSVIAADADRAFLTLLFSRSEITLANACVEDDTGVARLDTVVAPELQRRRLTATGSVETGITQPTAHACVHYKKTLAASWAELATFRDTYSWTFVSHSRTYPSNIAALTPQRQWDETCGSLLDLQAHGHQRGDGLFAWPNNNWDVGVQTNVVSTCFAFGRKYGGFTASTRKAVTTAPYWQQTRQTGGGHCNNTASPCSTVPITYTYISPARLAQLVAGQQPGTWLTLQSYVLVTGSKPGQWDCTAPAWQDHWTIDYELYCYVDWSTVLDAIPPGVVVTDPKTVAQAWGRTGYTPPS